MARVASLPHPDADLHRQLLCSPICTRGLSQMWSLAVEVSFYAALPALAYALLRQGTGWRPSLTLTRLALLAAVTPLPGSSSRKPPICSRTRPACGCPPTGLLHRRHGGGGPRRSRRTLACPGRHCRLATALFLVVATPIGGAIVGADPAWVPVNQGASLRHDRDTSRRHSRTRPRRPVHADPEQPTDGVARRDLL